MYIIGRNLMVNFCELKSILIVGLLKLKNILAFVKMRLEKLIHS